MHPIERLRYVARATDAPADDVVRDAAMSLAGFAEDPAALVTACRRLIDRHPANGPIWWLCARTLLAADPADEAWRCHSDLHADPTVRELGHALPEGATVAVVGWPDRLAGCFEPRGDVEVRVVDVEGDGPGFARLLDRLDVPAVGVDVAGLAPAVASSEVMLIDAAAIGPEVALAAPGSWAAAAVAQAADVPVWLVAGRGRSLPSGLWGSLERRLGSAASPNWEHGIDRVPLSLVDRVAGPGGVEAPARALATVDTPDVAELRR